MKKANNMEDNNAALMESCRVYEDLQAAYQDLERNMVSSPQAASAINERIKALLQQSKEIERQLQKNLAGDFKNNVSTTQLLRKREELLENLIVKNKNIAKKAGNIASHIQHEMRVMHTNRHAMKGYRPVSSRSKSLINSSF